MRKPILLLVWILSVANTGWADGWRYDEHPLGGGLSVGLGQSGAKSEGSDVGQSESLFSTHVLVEAQKKKGFDWSEILNAVLGSSKKAPTGAQSDPVSVECSGPHIERLLLAAQGDIKRVGHILNDYVNRCDQMLSRNNRRDLLALFDYENLIFDTYNTPGINGFRLQTPFNEEITGLIARKPGYRPWVILKCGIFCEAEASANNRNMLMHLFEEAPFNLVILSNQTSVSNILANHRVNFGGFYEGQEVLSVAYWLRHESPFAADVAAVHALGVSLGGNAVLYAALYNDHNLFHGQKLLNSALAYCPAVSMKSTVNEVFRDTPKGILFSMKTWSNLRRVTPFIEELQSIVPRSQPKIRKYPELIAQMSVQFLSRLDPNSFLAPFRLSKPVADRNEFWQLNDFLNYSRGLETPTLVWASLNDWVVNNGLNASQLEVRHNLDAQTNLRVVNMKYGSHCAKSVSYGWQAISAIFRGYFLAFTDAQAFRAEDGFVPLQIPAPRLSSRQQIAGYEWRARPGATYAELDYKIWNEIEDVYNGCGAGYGRVPDHNFNPFTSDRQCYETKTVRVPLTALGSINIHSPSDKREAAALTRYLNSHVELTNANGSIIGGRTGPNSIRVRSYATK